MKKLLIIILSLIALQSFGQNDFNGKNIFRDSVKLYKQTQYQGNYGSLFNDRSHVDKGYVDSSRNKARDSVVTIVGALKYSKAITIESPTSSENIGMFYTDVAITITKLAEALRGTSPSVTYNINHSTDRSSGSPNLLFSSDRTATSTTGTTTTTFNDATIPAGSWIWLTTSATSGTISSINITLIYTKD